jgi:hypothetical protein
MPATRGRWSGKRFGKIGIPNALLQIAGQLGVVAFRWGRPFRPPPSNRDRGEVRPAKEVVLAQTCITDHWKGNEHT